MNPNHDELGRFASGSGARELTKSEASAVREYARENLDQGGGYFDVNAFLRKGENEGPKTKEAISEIDSAFSGAGVLGSGGVVYRGLSGGRVPSVGKTYTDKGYVSTSLSADVAAEFGSSSSGNVTVLAIHLPKGTRCLNLGARKLGLKAEKEVLLPRGSRFKVTRITQRENGDRLVHATLLLGGR